MQPVHEYGGNGYFTRMYDINGARPNMARRMGNVNPGDGIKYCGRGYVQLTWKNNYLRMGNLIGENLVDNPDLAMRPDIAVKIMFIGMTSEVKNTFSGVNLQKYFNENNEDWVGARHVINGTDHAELLAETSQKFYDNLELVEE
jgi:predicted chitinase